jgi:hypothetical protein
MKNLFAKGQSRKSQNQAIINYSLFGPNLIDLSYQANQESKSFTSQLLLENLAIRVSNKLRILADQALNAAIKRRIEYKVSHQKPLSPHDLLLYRSQFWEQVGESNYQKINHKIEKVAAKKHTKYNEDSASLFSRLLLQELFQLKEERKLTLVQSTQGLGQESSDSEIYIFFDSYYFFASGHLNNLEESIDNLLSTNSNITVVFLLDRRMMLFPCLSKIILEKCSKRIIFDATEFPIKLTDRPAKALAVSKLAKDNKLNLGNSIISNDCILNARIIWNIYPYKSNCIPQKAWCSTFTRSQSKSIVNFELNRLSGTSPSRQYVVIHFRNSALMSDNIRNTKPLSDRKELLKGIIGMGLQVIVLGIMEPASKLKHPDVFYIDELGPIKDDIQVHMLHGAIGILGSPSGITHLTYCTDTPLLLVDMPFPFCSSYPASNMKALLKKPILNSSSISLSKYYQYTQGEHLEEIRNNRAYSPMYEDNIELVCNSDGAILHAFQELLIDTYKQSALGDFEICQSNVDIDIEAMERDKHAINSALNKSRLDSDKYLYFKASDLSTSNWLRVQTP